MIKIKYYLLLIMLINNLYSKTENIIIPCQNLDQFKIAISKLNTQDLVIFDVGNVIIRRTDNFFCQGKSNKKIKEKIFKEYDKYCTKKGKTNILTADKKLNLWSKLKNNAATTLFSEETLELIHKIQQKGIRTIAHTKMDVGSGQIKERLENHRIKMLSYFNINFNNSFNIDKLELTDTSNINSKPIFKKGVLFADQSTKGDVLKSFLNKINFYPKNIVMIDDQIEYLKSVAQATKKLNINFVGINYRAIENYKQKKDKQLNKFQLNYFFKKGKWLSDENAKQIMEN